MPTFANPSMLVFLLLASIPIIIYLINRQRYRRVRWAAMEFLLRAMQKNRRRLRLENLLLLVIRTLIVLFFVMAFARPFFESGSILDLGARMRSEIIIIDRSYSMASLAGNKKSLDEAIGLSQKRIRSLGKNDQLGIFLAGGSFADVVYKEPQRLADRTRNDIIAQLGEVDIVYEPIDLATTLQQVGVWVEQAGKGATWKAHLYTDMQERDWFDERSTARSGVQEALDRLNELGVSLHIHNVGDVRVRNAIVEDVRSEEAILAVDLPTSFHVSVRNPTGKSLAGLEVELFVDGALQGSKKVALDPRESRVVSFPHVFREPGLQRIQAVLKTDDLVEDNLRQIVINVREAVDVAIVDGGQGQGDRSDDAIWLAVAFGADYSTDALERLSPFQARVVGPEALESLDETTDELLILADPGKLTAGASEKIGRFLEAGGGILFFYGDRALDARMSYVEHGHRDGEGWFPFVPGELVYDETQKTTYGWNVVLENHPIGKYFVEDEAAGLSLVRVHGYGTVESEVPENKVVIRMDDYRKTPVLVENRVGKGNLLVVNSGADREWSDTFPQTPAFLCLLMESMTHLSLQQMTRRTLGVGDSFTRILKSTEFSSQVYLYRPDDVAVRLDLPLREDKTTFDLLVPEDQTLIPGLYEIRFGDAGRSDQELRTEWLAVNPDPEEGDLSMATVEELREVYVSESLEFSDQETLEDKSGDSDSSGDIWRTLMWAVLGLVVAETLLARMIGRTR